jgi:hypothetical protein
MEKSEYSSINMVRLELEAPVPLMARSLPFLATLFNTTASGNSPRPDYQALLSIMSQNWHAGLSIKLILEDNIVFFDFCNSNSSLPLYLRSITCLLT